MIKIDREWQRLAISPADRNEFIKLELPKAWEPSDSSGASPYGEGEETQHSFLMETKLRTDKMERVRIQLGFEYMFAVDRVGKSDGLALLWTVEAGVEIQNYSCRHINVKLCSSPNKPL